MRLYSCCSDTRCDTHQAALRFLREWGIKPTIGHDEGYYMEFDIPKNWPRNRRRRFQAALRKRTNPMPGPTPEPDPGNYPCAHCEATPGTCLTDCPCGHWLPTCTGCLGTGRIAPCPDCGVVPTPRTWPAPGPGFRGTQVRTFGAMYRAHLSALVGCARWCHSQRVVSKDGRDCGVSGLAAGYFGMVGARLYDLEQAWASTGIGFGDLAPVLNKDEVALGRAAVALGAFVEKPKGSSEALDPLLLALLRAAEPLLSWGNDSPPAARESSKGHAESE